MSVKLRWKTIAKGRKSAYLDICTDSERYKEYLKIHVGKGISDSKEKKQLAESIRAKRELQLVANEHGFKPKFKKDIDFLAYYQKFIDEYPNKDVRLVQYSLAKFKLVVTSKTLPIKSLTPKICEDYANFLKSEASGLNGDTPQNYWTKFRKVVRSAVRDELLIKNPSDGIRVKKLTGQLKKNILTIDELKAVAKTECGNPTIKRAFIFACFTGLGMAEIRKLTYRRVQNDKLIVFREKTGEQILNDLHPTAKKMIGEFGGIEESVFKDLPSDSSISKTLKRWILKAGIEKNISFYCGRHTFATQLLLNGANLKTVADCLGHTSTKHTIKYLNYVDSLKTDAINSLPQLDF
jgi:integrase